MPLLRSLGEWCRLRGQGEAFSVGIDAPDSSGLYSPPAIVSLTLLAACREAGGCLDRHFQRLTLASTLPQQLCQGASDLVSGICASNNILKRAVGVRFDKNRAPLAQVAAQTEWQVLLWRFRRFDGVKFLFYRQGDARIRRSKPKLTCLPNG